MKPLDWLVLFVGMFFSLTNIIAPKPKTYGLILENRIRVYQLIHWLKCKPPAILHKVEDMYSFNALIKRLNHKSKFGAFE